jgi:RimJ/RimL family protein N-acetyltransferase
MIFTWLQVKDIPETWKIKLRELCLPPGRNDPAGGTMYRWTYHDGSTWAYILFDGPEAHPFYIAGWAAMTLEEEPEPVIGVYVDNESRAQGFASLLVAGLLRVGANQIKEKGSKVIAVDSRFPKYRRLIENAGFIHKEWV